MGSISGTGRLSMQKKPMSSSARTAVLFPEPESPLTMTIRTWWAGDNYSEASTAGSTSSLSGFALCPASLVSSLRLTAWRSSFSMTPSTEL